MGKPIPPKAIPKPTTHYFMVFLSGFPGVKNNKISGDFITGRSDNSQTASTNEKSTLKIIAHPSASYGLLPKR